MNKTNIKDLEAARNYLDQLIDNAEDYIAELDREIAENERLIEDCINARKVLKNLEAKEDHENERYSRI